MAADEAQELQEQHEQAAQDGRLRPVSFTMSVFAVLVAITTVMGHRAHTEAVLNQAKASDQWNLYQAKKIRQYDTGLIVDMLKQIPLKDPSSASALTNSYQAHLKKWNDDLNDEETEAHRLEVEVRHSERKGDRFDLGEALLEIGLVVTSITLLTRQRAYWVLGMVFGAAGLVVSAFAFIR